MSPLTEQGKNAGLGINVFYGNKILRNHSKFKGILKKWRPGIKSRDAICRDTDLPLS